MSGSKCLPTQVESILLEVERRNTPAGGNKGSSLDMLEIRWISKNVFDRINAWKNWKIQSEPVESVLGINAKIRLVEPGYPRSEERQYV